MKYWALAICLLLTAVYPVHGAVGEKHIEQVGLFALHAPKGWLFRDLPGMKYQIAVGPVASSFSPNINVVDEAYDGSLKSYVDANVKGLGSVFDKFTLLGRESFITARGLRGEKLTITSVQQKKFLRQSFYMFPGSSGHYFVVTCTTLAEGGETLDATFDESIKTFEIIK